jgi:hypothetical protein
MLDNKEETEELWREASTMTHLGSNGGFVAIASRIILTTPILIAGIIHPPVLNAQEPTNRPEATNVLSSADPTPTATPTAGLKNAYEEKHGLTKQEIRNQAEKSLGMRRIPFWVIGILIIGTGLAITGFFVLIAKENSFYLKEYNLTVTVFIMITITAFAAGMRMGVATGVYKTLETLDVATSVVVENAGDVVESERATMVAAGDQTKGFSKLSWQSITELMLGAFTLFSLVAFFYRLVISGEAPGWESNWGGLGGGLGGFHISRSLALLILTIALGSMLTVVRVKRIDEEIARQNVAARQPPTPAQTPATLVSAPPSTTVGSQQ